MNFLPLKEELGDLGSKYLLVVSRVMFNDPEGTPPLPKSPDFGKCLCFDRSTEAHSMLYELIGKTLIGFGMSVNLSLRRR
ncbi:unnamed protein product [Dovyalis caffra]|uniref:Uncharacterized protein n=1 Tax=Dovyalis caffra TaxID=77055 RepID=A0AAV1SP97_9ROSI|nr:unnamed protein product [Dovyalis caffra]